MAIFVEFENDAFNERSEIDDLESLVGSLVVEVGERAIDHFLHKVEISRHITTARARRLEINSQLEPG